VHRGLLAVNDPIVRFFPDYQPIANSDTRKQSMTVRDLLTMRSGLDWSESNYGGSPLQRLNDCRCDWLRFVLDWPMREQPGTRWEYVSGGTILLGGVIGRAARARLDQFADAELFDPLGVVGASWFQGLPDSLPHAGGGLNLRPRDMAKLGLLVLDNGRWQGRPILPPAWIRESTERIERGVAAWASRSFDYGYYWWISSAARGDLITASGARGQWIFISPADRLVLVSTAENGDGRGIAAVDFLHAYVLAAVRG
jgi:CubicO group peptidase (beta-lactamase class C family)